VHVSADADIVIAGGKGITGVGADRDVPNSVSVASEGMVTNGGVVVAGVALERFPTEGRVAGAGGVVKERTKTNGRVVAADGVKTERINTVGRVAAGASVG
jgi:hypothetical protein